MGLPQQRTTLGDPAKHSAAQLGGSICLGVHSSRSAPGQFSASTAGAGYLHLVVGLNLFGFGRDRQRDRCIALVSHRTHQGPQRAMDAAADLARLLMSGASSAEQCDMASNNAGAPCNKRRRLNSRVLSPATLDGSTDVPHRGTKHSAAGPTCVSHSSDRQGENTSHQVQVKVVSPTIGGIAEASRSLRQERVAHSPTRRDSNGEGTAYQVSQDNSSIKALQRLRLVSFPTECFYTIACSVKIASSKSVSRVRSSQSSSSLSSMSSPTSSPTNCPNDAVDGSSSLADAVHQPNSSLDFIASCCTAYPCAYVRGKNDALTLCQVSLHVARWLLDLAPWLTCLLFPPPPPSTFHQVLQTQILRYSPRLFQRRLREVSCYVTAPQVHIVGACER